MPSPVQMKYAVEAAHGYAVSSGEGHSSTRLFGNIYFDEMGDSAMKVEELVFFPTQLVHVETIRFNAEKKLEKAGMKYRIKAETRGEVVDEKMGKSYIKICVENNGYYFEEEKVGVFQFSEKITDEKSAVQFMEVQGVRILWSYIREDLYTISSKMLPHPIMIPTIDVMKTLEKAK